VQLEYFFMTDALYLPSIFKDCVAEGNSLGDWYLNPSPNFFPDMIAYRLLNALVGDFRLASYIYPFAQMLVIGLLLRAIVRENKVARHDLGVSLGLLLFVLPVFSGWWADDFITSFQLLVNSYHMGAFVNALLCAWLSLRYLRRFAARELIALIAITMLGGASDKLFWVMFVAPAMAASALLAFNAPMRRRALVLLVLLPLVSFISWWALNAIEEALPMMIAEPYAMLDFEHIGKAWDKFLGLMGWYLGNNRLGAFMIVCALLVLLGSAWAAWRLARQWRSRIVQAEAEDVLPLAAGIMAFTFMPLVLFAPMLNGAFDGADSIRYNIAAFLFAAFVVGVSIGNRSLIASRFLGVGMLLLVGAPSLWACLQFGDYERLASFKPKRVATLDSLASEHGLKHGVAGYWDAKVITLFSEKGLNVLPVFPQLAVYIHVNREDMFYWTNDGDTLRYDFVMMNKDFNEPQVGSELPVPYTKVERDGVVLLLTPPWSHNPATRIPKPQPVPAPVDSTGLGASPSAPGQR
jgi:hypothetical protein